MTSATVALLFGLAGIAAGYVGIFLAQALSDAWEDIQDHFNYRHHARLYQAREAENIRQRLPRVLSRPLDLRAIAQFNAARRGHTRGRWTARQMALSPFAAFALDARTPDDI